MDEAARNATQVDLRSYLHELLPTLDLAAVIQLTTTALTTAFLVGPLLQYRIFTIVL